MFSNLIRLAAASLLSITLILSCSKSNKEPQPPDTDLNPSDAVALSAALKIWHSQRLTGNPPTPNNNPAGPQLETANNNQNIPAIAGRYAIIQPEIVGGSVAGYYVAVQGANEYFKIDYSRPRERAAGRSLIKNKIRQLYRGDSLANAEDSAIVITIPDNIQPGEFCVSYWAYDSAGNISNTISHCITIDKFGGDASTAYLAGRWKASAQRDASNEPWTPFDYSAYSETQTYYCNPVDTMPGFYTIEQNCHTANCESFTDTATYEKVEKFDMLFASNGGMQYDVRLIYNIFSGLELTNGCGNTPLVDLSENIALIGAWSYDAATNKLLIVFDFNTTGDPDPEILDVILAKDSDQQISLFADDGSGLRLIKQ